MDRLPDTIPLRNRILVVEDEARLRELWQRAIREMELHAVGVRSGEDALAAVREQDFGIVLLDLNLPGIDGMWVLRELRRIRPATAVIIITGFGSLSAAQEAIHFDVLEFLTKPCSLGDLERAIDRARRRIGGEFPVPAVDVEPAPTSTRAPSDKLEDVERRHILEALHRNQGNRTAAARELGISLRKLYYKLADYQRQGYIS